MDIKSNIDQALSTNASSRMDALSQKRTNERDLVKVSKLANEFEAMFIEQMLKGMRTSIPKSGLIDGGNAEDIYTGMLDSEYAKTMAGQRSTGLADMIERQLLQSMGVQVSRPINKLRSGLAAYQKNPTPYPEKILK